MVSETVYQNKLIRKLQTMYPEAIILKNDPSEVQGIPDLLILHGPNWAMLEVKLAEDSPVRPNQGWHVRRLDDMSFAAFIYPENEEDVLYELQSALGPCG